jgi:hypothetical protein
MSVKFVLNTNRVMIVTIKDFGACPCPRCTISVEQIPAMGREDDRKRRKELRRRDDAERREKVDEARTNLYDKGYAISGDYVDGLLKGHSMVPTKVFSFVLLASEPDQPFLRMLSQPRFPNLALTFTR